MIVSPGWGLRDQRSRTTANIEINELLRTKAKTAIKELSRTTANTEINELSQTTAGTELNELSRTKQKRKPMICREQQQKRELSLETRILYQDVTY